MNLHNLNFANSDLRQSVFSDILGNITSLALTPDGKCSATADMDVDTHLWQVGKGKQLLTESIQDTSPRIHPWRNKKRVSDETCPPNLSVGSMLQSKI
jgi:hypothetical protein